MTEAHDRELPTWYGCTNTGAWTRLITFKTEIHTSSGENTCQCPLNSRGVLVSDLLAGEDPDCPFDPKDFWRHD